MPGWAGRWEKCPGKNSDRGQCKAPLGRHLTHKKYWADGKWYGQLASKEPTKLQKPKRRTWRDW
jgi:hypothetical protein